MHRFLAVFALASIAALASCGGSATGPYNTGGGGTGGGGGGTGGNNTSNAVTVGNDFFSPSTTTVPVGTTVTWTWSAGDVAHSVTFDDGTTSSIQSSGSYTRTFTTAGTYMYHCKVHGAAMSGEVIVQ